MPSILHSTQYFPLKTKLLEIAFKTHTHTSLQHNKNKSVRYKKNIVIKTLYIDAFWRLFYQYGLRLASPHCGQILLR